MHSVHRLFQYRQSISTKPFAARGKKVSRCPLCRVAQQYCICQYVHQVNSNVGFVLLMHDIEVLKPSNTGRLIADIIPQTHAFLWSRTNLDQNLEQLLSNDAWQPIVVFPEQYASVEQKLIKHQDLAAMRENNEHRKPLFILLDGSWREAKKMFRKSPYLAELPILSLSSQDFNNSGYQLRDSEIENQFSTAGVAARALHLAGEAVNSELLKHWLDVFNYQYQRSVCQKNYGNPQALENYQAFLKQHY